VQFFSWLHPDFLSFNFAQQNIGSADANLQGAGKTCFAYQLYALASTKTHRKQALVQCFISVETMVAISPGFILASVIEDREDLRAQCKDYSIAASLL
jgi:hypothetical protein